jgi:hypothetical protein
MVPDTRVLSLHSTGELALWDIVTGTKVPFVFQN